MTNAEQRVRDLEARVDLLQEAIEAAIYALRNNGYAGTAEILERALQGIGQKDRIISGQGDSDG